MKNQFVMDSTTGFMSSTDAREQMTSMPSVATCSVSRHDLERTWIPQKRKERADIGHHMADHWVGWLVVLRIHVASVVFQPYRDLEAGDNQSLKISSDEAGNRTPVLLLRKPRA